MLIVREAQMAALARAREDAFERFAAEAMDECWPEICARFTYDELLARVRVGLESARQFGLVGDQALCNYLNVHFAMGPEFPLGIGDAWAREILNLPGENSIARVDRLVDRAAAVLSALAMGGQKD